MGQEHIASDHRDCCRCFGCFVHEVKVTEHNLPMISLLGSVV